MERKDIEEKVIKIIAEIIIGNILKIFRQIRNFITKVTQIFYICIRSSVKTCCTIGTL